MVEIGGFVFQSLAKGIEERLQPLERLARNQSDIVKAKSCQDVEYCDRIQRINNEQHNFEPFYQCNGNSNHDCYMQGGY